MKKHKSLWVTLALWLVAAVPVSMCAVQEAVAAPSRDGWVAGWTAAPSDAFLSVTVQDQTIRQLVTVHQGGQAVRLRLSNRFGKEPVTLNELWVGASDHDAAVQAGSSRRLLFAGKPAVTLAPGSSMVSDPVRMAVKPMQRLAVSLYAAGRLHSVSRHFRSSEYLWQASGNRTQNEDGLGFAQFNNPLLYSWVLMEGLDVQVSEPHRVLVAWGDSITDGHVSTLGLPWLPSMDTVGQDARYPDYLARRFIAAGKPVSVVNAGISGNRLLTESVVPVKGPSGLSRLQQDVIQVQGATDVLVLIGINDLGNTPAASAGDIITGLKTTVARLQQAGLRVVLGTLLPSRGTLAGHGLKSVDDARRQINRWILSGHTADGVVDFDACLRDPAAPSYLLAAYDSGDHLHPNAQGYQAMADCVDLRMFP